jgi:hypothetical protein
MTASAILCFFVVAAIVMDGTKFKRPRDDHLAAG